MPARDPYIPATHFPSELTPRALLLGVGLGLIFSASSVYLALKIGLTVSSSIPIAVLSITIFRALGRTSILENNIVQTTGSASDSVAAGVVFTIPAILLMGYDLEISRVAVLATVGGLMGVLMMIPLRRALIVREHDTLIYPEGTACAEVLIAGEERGLQAKRVFQAFGVGFVYKFLMGGLKLWPDVPGRAFAFYPGAAVATEISPELLGVGYIIGPQISGYLFAGGCLAYLVLAPAIKLVGSGLSEPFGFPAVKLIRDMSPGELRASFVFYIGAGAVASAGLIALARSLPTILSSFAASWKDLRDSRLGQAVTKVRTDDDLPVSLTVGGSVILAIVLALLPQVGVNLLGAILIVIFGFFFATVSSRICGQIGSSANPISGMTIAALLGTCLIFVAIGWTGVDHRVQAISIAAVVAVATANAGNTSQDLKTGFLVGATPRRQQIAILVGALGSALVVGWTLTLLNRSYTYPVPEVHPAFRPQALVAGGPDRAPVEILPQTMSGFRIAGGDSVDHASYQVVRVYVVTQGVAAGKYLMDPATRELRYVLDPGIGGRVHEYHGRAIPRLDSPKATIMALITDGILTRKLPWVLVLLGVFITVAIELMGVQALPVAVGVYLPISTSSAMFVGGVVRWLIERRAQARAQSLAEVESGPGVLFASGLIAGGAICGIVLAAIAGVLGSADALAGKAPLFRQLGDLSASNALGFGLFAALGVLLYGVALRHE
ncbi:MAG TPA: oligopeptide transporter, OPT family [Gemmatimonadales bacterium]|nr:oligopeptide transporter, OPT family [Gemmatimonadales bacterium]